MKRLCLLLTTLLSVASAQSTSRYVVVLTDPPVANFIRSHKDVATAAARNQRQLVQSKQRALKATLESRGVHVHGSVDTIANALFVVAKDDEVQQIRSIPGVKMVVRDLRLKRQMNAALPLMNVPNAWNFVGGAANAGAGIRIAVLDSGIDQTHPSFQAPSLTVPTGFPICDNSVGDCAFTNNKVIVARSYVYDLNLYFGNDPMNTRPDDYSPRDHVGHGTAVAMIAAGVQTTTPDHVTLSGVAPGAFLGNYKIFGSPGVNDITYSSVFVNALNDAFNDKMDIAVVSLGTPALWDLDQTGSTCGNTGNDPCDWQANAVETAVQKGLAVVVAAGNDSLLGTQSAMGTIQTPGTAPDAITVGATTNSHVIYQTVKVNGSGVPSSLTSVNTYFSDGPRPATTLTAKVVDVASTGNDGYACTTLPASSLAGSIALIQRGNCTFGTKVVNAQNAGAVGVIIYAAQGDGIFRMTGLGNTGVPAVLIGNTAGTALKNYVKSNASATATLDPTPRIVDNTGNQDFIAYFSSQGPSLHAQQIKPELVATGSDLYVATQNYDPSGDLWSPTRYVGVQGTSFAAAIVAGAGAIVYGVHPEYNPPQLKSALVNTANPTVYDLNSAGQQVVAGVNADGAGKLDALAAAQTNVVVSPSTVSFGNVKNPSVGSLNQVLTLQNTGKNSLNLQISVQPIETDNNNAVTVGTSSLTLAGGQSQQITVQLTGSSVPPAGSHSGDIVITGGAVSVHVPYLYVSGDGVPSNLIPLENTDFLRGVQDQMLIGFKVLDQYGVPVPNANVSFASTLGGGSIAAATPTTDSLGIAEANVNLGSTVGDQEFSGKVTGTDLAVYFDGRARALPVIDSSAGVVDATTFKVPQAFAPGSYMTIKGTALSDSTQSTGAANQPLPVSLSGVSVSFDVPNANISVPGHISYVSPTQINVQVPWELAGQSGASMKVSLGDYVTSAMIPGAAYPFAIDPTAPGFFQFNDPSKGTLVAAALDENYRLVTTTNPVQRGHVVQLFLNGLGPTTNQPASGDPAKGNPLSYTNFSPTITIGGQNAPVSFSGMAPGFVGLYQVNATVPSGIGTGVQSLTVSSNGVSSAQASLPIQ